MPRYDLILTSWNRLAYLQQTIASLIASGVLANVERAIIVDNNSTEEGVKEFLKDMQEQYGFYVVHRQKNDGWGTAVNDALGISRAPYLFLLNNDETFDENFHETMLNAMASDERIALVGGWRHQAHGLGEFSNEQFQEMDDVPAVCWLLSKVAMEQVGMLAEKGPCFTKGGNGEDTDYTQRLKARGFLVGVTTNDVAHHIDGY